MRKTIKLPCGVIEGLRAGNEVEIIVLNDENQRPSATDAVLRRLFRLAPRSGQRKGKSPSRPTGR
jgi:hypothetical protein